MREVERTTSNNRPRCNEGLNALQMRSKQRPSATDPLHQHPCQHHTVELNQLAQRIVLQVHSRPNLQTLGLSTGEIRQNAKELLLSGGGRHGADLARQETRNRRKTNDRG